MRRRILLATLFTVAVTGLALGIPLTLSMVTVVETISRQQLASKAQQIATTLDDDLADGRPLNLAKFQYGAPDGGRIVVRTQARTLEFGADPGADPIEERIPLVRGGSVRLIAPSGPTRDEQVRMGLFVVLVLVGSLAIGTLVASVTARRLSRPLRDVAERADRLGAGDFRPENQRYGVAELDMVAGALDTAATALNRLVQRERNLVGDVSHQLRSRLTALQLRIEGLVDSPDEDTAAEAGAAMEQADKLGKVLDDLLAESRAARANEARPVELSEQLRAIAEEWRPVVRACGGSLELRIPDGLRAVATPSRLREAIGVLLDNAVKHGGGKVRLSVRQEESTVVVQVSDGGSGVPDEFARHMFERGVSGGGSSGVGLALARALVDADGGRLELSVRRPATFSLFLLAPPPPPEPQAWRTAPR
ncbi:ATP-binding protein [Sciscionella marina]|uniref:ATP-binding protein n=1 Tax=Sciscionella marina TaxID=508770 RepID=UPI0003723FA9|nr:ATP-binding protein [Sciscionella marina]